MRQQAVRPRHPRFRRVSSRNQPYQPQINFVPPAIHHSFLAVRTTSEWNISNDPNPNSPKTQIPQSPQQWLATQMGYQTPPQTRRHPLLAHDVPVLAIPVHPMLLPLPHPRPRRTAPSSRSPACPSPQRPRAERPARARPHLIVPYDVRPAPRPERPVHESVGRRGDRRL